MTPAQTARPRWQALRLFCLLGALETLGLSPAVQAKDLLSGDVAVENGATVKFTLSGESRENVKDGEMALGERAFRITASSRTGLVGGERTVENTAEPTHEYAVFSSSFSEQTATGQPWVKATHYLNCDKPYNSFIAIYRVVGAERIKTLGVKSHPQLAEGTFTADQADAYCFTSRPIP